MIIGFSLSVLIPFDAFAERIKFETKYSFDDFKVKDFYQGRPHVDFKSNSGSGRFRTAIRSAVKRGTNFGGHYAIAEWGCGTNCQNFVIVNLVTGQIIDGLNTSCGIQYKKDSRIIIVEPPDADGYYEVDPASAVQCVPEIYVLKEERLKPLSLASSAEPNDQQTIFGSENNIKKPVDVPDDVLQILRQDERNQSILAEGESANEIKRSSIVASKINLGNDSLQDLIVMATDPQLFGANVVPFWVFHHKTQGYKEVLSVSALGLEVLNTKTNGFRDILVTRATARDVISTVFRFDGLKYQVASYSQNPVPGMR